MLSSDQPGTSHKLTINGYKTTPNVNLWEEYRKVKGYLEGKGFDVLRAITLSVEVRSNVTVNQ